ncbi:MAG: hypothetical protein KKC78_15780 [Proteobacteria bacterium]|nr:hypothetical protein [Pseudomonadota bacterium]
MVVIRAFEERVQDLYARGHIPGLAHLYIGEEAIAAGVCANLGDKDYITSTHRGHGHVIAKGALLKPMMAELYGKETGYCKGKGGSMHIADVDLGILGANGIAGGGLPIAVGAGLSCKMKHPGHVAVCFFGDASSNNGTFHESLNFAAVHKLPVVFVCENNGFGISVSQAQHQAITDIAIRAAGYGMPGDRPRPAPGRRPAAEAKPGSRPSGVGSWPRLNPSPGSRAAAGIARPRASRARFPGARRVRGGGTIPAHCIECPPSPARGLSPGGIASCPGRARPAGGAPEATPGPGPTGAG